MTNDPAPAPGDVDAFAERIFGAVLGAQLTQAIDLGDRLGWYRALADGGPATSGELRPAPAAPSATPASGSSTRPPAAS